MTGKIDRTQTGSIGILSRAAMSSGRIQASVPPPFMMAIAVQTSSYLWSRSSVNRGGASRSLKSLNCGLPRTDYFRPRLLWIRSLGELTPSRLRNVPRCMSSRTPKSRLYCLPMVPMWVSSLLSRSWPLLSRGRYPRIPSASFAVALPHFHFNRMLTNTV
jgi:hypothetical protein